MQELSDLDVLIIDCQTTGASPALGAVLEIGWGIARPTLPGIRQLQAHWVTLPDEHFVGFHVRRLTGFGASHAATAIRPFDAWTRLRQTTNFAARVPVAIHFARFELAFLRDWSGRFEPDTSFPLDAVCVHDIACRLYPDLPRRSIRALAGYLGHSVDLARRCMGHVEATAFIWCKLTTELAALGVRTWDDLGDWLNAPPPPRSRRRRYPLPSARYRAMPDEPGVYHFVRSNGDVLYVGKAASLRKRVPSHFTAGASTTERALEMLTQVHDIRITLARTPLEAALLENESIKALRPPYNVQLVAGDPRMWFTSSDFGASSRQPDAICRRGPLPSILSVRALGAIAALLSGETPSALLRARSVGAAERWAPDEASFSVGFARFAARPSLTSVPSTIDVRRSLAATARQIIVATKETALSEASDLEADSSDDEALALPAWDPARVVRHLERSVAHAYQLLQRARWLCLLYDSAIVFREPASSQLRLLLIHHGNLVEARDVAPDEPTAQSVSSHPLHDRKAEIDRVYYDRLRTLTSELKRVLRDDGTVAVRVGQNHWLRGATLANLLRWV